MSVHVHEDDSLSYCGSFSGDTFSSRRRRAHCSLRRHDDLAKRLRELALDADSVAELAIHATGDASQVHTCDQKARCNTCFHHFRFVVVMLGGLAFGMMILLRYNITVAILSMVNQTALYMDENPNSTIDDFLAEGYSLGGEFDWDNEIQQTIMSWYMFAYTIPQVPCTKLGITMGARLAVPIMLSLCIIANLLTPSFAYLGWQYVVGLRLLNGLGGCAICPLMLHIIEHYMPYDELLLGLTCAQILQASLTAINPLFSGWLASIHWVYVFYVPAAVGVVFCIVWLVLITDSPDDNVWLSHEELKLICGCHKLQLELAKGKEKQQQQPSRVVDMRDKLRELTWPPEQDQPKQAKPGMVDILKIPSFYACLVMWMFHCSTYCAFSFFLPTYLRQTLKVNVSTNGLYCFLIQSGCIISVIWPHPFLRYLQSNSNLSLDAVRRLSYVLICFMVAATWAYVGLFHESQVLMLFLNRCFHGSNDIVVTATIMSNYAKAGLTGMAFSMIASVGHISVVLTSNLIGYALDEMHQSLMGWTYIYVIFAGCHLLMLLVYTTMMRSGPIEFKLKG